MAERQAAWARAAFNLLSGLTIALVATGCCCLPTSMSEGARSPEAASQVNWIIGLCVGGAAALLCVACVVWWFVQRLTRRESTPLPPPAPDPLVTYREGGPVECPRHPFAR